MLQSKSDRVQRPWQPQCCEISFITRRACRGGFFFSFCKTFTALWARSKMFYLRRHQPSVLKRQHSFYRDQPTRLGVGDRLDQWRAGHMHHLGSLLRERRERQLFRRRTRLRLGLGSHAGSLATAGAVACFVSAGLAYSLPLAIILLGFGFVFLFALPLYQ